LKPYAQSSAGIYSKSQHIWSASRYPGFNDGMVWDTPTSMDDLTEPLRRSLKAGRRVQHTPGQSKQRPTLNLSDVLGCVRKISSVIGRWGTGHTLQYKNVDMLLKLQRPIEFKRGLLQHPVYLPLTPSERQIFGQRYY